MLKAQAPRNQRRVPNIQMSGMRFDSKAEFDEFIEDNKQQNNSEMFQDF